MAEAFDEAGGSFAPSFGEGTLVRVHFIILRNLGKDPKPDLALLEPRIVEVVRNWGDRLESALVARGADRATIALWRGAFLPGYRDSAGPASSPRISRRSMRSPRMMAIGVEFIRNESDGQRELHSRLYHQGDALALGRRLPILENHGPSGRSETSPILSPGLIPAAARAPVITARRDCFERPPECQPIGDHRRRSRRLEEAFHRGGGPARPRIRRFQRAGTLREGLELA